MFDDIPALDFEVPHIELGEIPALEFEPIPDIEFDIPALDIPEPAWLEDV